MCQSVCTHARQAVRVLNGTRYSFIMQEACSGYINGKQWNFIIQERMTFLWKIDGVDNVANKRRVL